jgi:hypothetical protein
MVEQNILDKIPKFKLGKYEILHAFAVRGKHWTADVK